MKDFQARFTLQHVRNDELIGAGQQLRTESLNVQGFLTVKKNGNLDTI